MTFKTSFLEGNILLPHSFHGCIQVKEETQDICEEFLSELQKPRRSREGESVGEVVCYEFMATHRIAPGCDGFGERGLKSAGGTNTSGEQGDGGNEPCGES